MGMVGLSADMLNKLRALGRVTLKAPLAPYTTFKIGGVADVLFEPSSLESLGVFWGQKPKDVPVTLLGGGSNVLIRDGGIRGIVVLVHAGCDAVHIQQTALYAEAGASTGKVARAARTACLSGVEFLCGIPGSIGGALVMNAGCYGQELKDSLIAVDIIDPQGQRHTLPVEAFDFSYRKSVLPQGWLFAAAHLRLQKAEAEAIRTRMRTVNHKRATSQPLKWPNAGSLFKNPPGEKAWQLIDKAGCRGLREGGAQVSEKHCNFFVNTGGATAMEVENLAYRVQEKVRQTLGVDLEWEVWLLGDRAQSF